MTAAPAIRHPYDRHTHTHPFNGPLSRTTRVGRYEKGKTNLDFTGARDSEWQWHQLGMCKSAPRSRQITTPAHHHSSFLQPGCPSCRPTNSVKALKALMADTWRVKSRQSISCFLRWQSRHRRRYSGSYDSHQKKTEKYSTLSSAYRFEPIAVENLGVFSSTTLNFISELGRRICVHTRDARETSYLFQRISIMLQRFNSVLLHDTLPVDLPDLWPSDILILAFLVFNPGDLILPGVLFL